MRSAGDPVHALLNLVVLDGIWDSARPESREDAVKKRTKVRKHCGSLEGDSTEVEPPERLNGD
jgi:hypothetical protein